VKRWHGIPSLPDLQIMKCNGFSFSLAWIQCLLISALFFSDASFAQQSTQIEIDNADTFEGDESLGKNVSRLLGNVRFRHQGALMYCDSAYLYQEANSLDAFGSIRIVQGDSVTLTGDFLKYDGNTRIARLTGKVVMTDRGTVLRTSILNYNLNNEISDYTDGGELTDKQNVLTSKTGYYYSKDRIVFFSDSVNLTNPDYYILADTLKYRTDTKVALFEGPTNIYSTGADSTIIYCERGWYNTITENSIFTRNPSIRSKENTLRGDSLIFDNTTRAGHAFGNVSLSDSIQDVIITGDYGFSDDRSKVAWVTGRALLIKVFEIDSLFLHADTLLARQDSMTQNKTWTAYNGVRIYKTDLQGKCDTLIYSAADSTLSFYHEPVLWSEENQLTAAFMNMQMANSKISELRLFDAAFIASQEDSIRFNQIKGRNMTGYFTDNKLSSIKVEGNGQSIYYTRNSNKQYTGVNRADCSDMLIFIDESKIKSITLINEPDATLFPIQELNPSELKLKGFVWLNEYRPVNREDVFRR
jgi:lipopolysaccharide export system protein LptA